MSFFCRATAVAVALGCVSSVAVASDDTPTVSPTPQIKVCDTAFFAVPLPDDASQCQPFSDALTADPAPQAEMPASLVYFTPLSNAAVIEFYQNKLSLTKHEPVNQRTLLVSDDSLVRIVVSPDNKGSQVDILVSQNTAESGE